MIRYDIHRKRPKSSNISFFGFDHEFSGNHEIQIKKDTHTHGNDKSKTKRNENIKISFKRTKMEP